MTPDPGTAAVRSISIMADGERSHFDDVIATAALNHEGGIEPPPCRIPGPEGFYATALWLRGAFAGLTHEIHHVVGDGDLVVVDVTMSGRHVGDFVLYDAEGGVERAYAPTGRSFAVRQTHWLRLANGKVTEHWAVRDDLGQALQLGWVPPTPRYLLRCSLAARRARRAASGG